MSRTRQAVLLVSHGTVEDLADLPAFVTNIRGGRPAPPELVRELERRYEAIGGRSPLGDTTRSLAAKLERRLEVPVRMAARLWKPYVQDVARELQAEKTVVVPLAQHSARVYVEAAQAVSAGVVGTGNWGQTSALLDAFARRIEALASSEHTTLVLTAHSLPKAVVDAGDPYEREVRAAAAGVAARVRHRFEDFVIAFQSQGMGHGQPWLGPTLEETIDALAARGRKRLVFAPIGFLADHVEILYDLDIEARARVEAKGMEYARSASLNDDDDLVAILEGLASPLLS